MRQFIRLTEALLNNAAAPVYEHDCDHCLFVGSDHQRPGEAQVNQVDMYVHRKPKDTYTLIRRFSSDAKDYTSQQYPGPVSPRFQPVLNAAQALGIIPVMPQSMNEGTVIDFDPQKTRMLFDLDLKGSNQTLSMKELRTFKQFLSQHKNDDIRLYHATTAKHDILGQGLLPTSTTRRRSMQSQSGYVYLSYDPRRALDFARFGYPTESPYAVYAVTVPIRLLRADTDQLRNKRYWGERSSADIGTSLADSLIHGAGARVRGKLEPWRLTLLGYYDKNGVELPSA